MLYGLFVKGGAKNKEANRLVLDIIDLTLIAGYVRAFIINTVINKNYSLYLFR